MDATFETQYQSMSIHINKRTSGTKYSFHIRIQMLQPMWCLDIVFVHISMCKWSMLKMGYMLKLPEKYVQYFKNGNSVLSIMKTWIQGSVMKSKWVICSVFWYEYKEKPGFIGNERNELSISYSKYSRKCMLCVQNRYEYEFLA